MPKLKQATLSSLKGVVIVEEFHRHKNILDNTNESDETVVKTLNYLEKKKPSKEVISSTGIDLTLQKLENHPNKEIADKVKNLLNCWKPDDSSKSQPTVEVRYDNLTRHIRRKAVQFFREALGGQEADDKIADTLEKEIFHKCERLISKTYRRTIRKVVFMLRHQELKRTELTSGEITHAQFISKYVDFHPRR